MIQSWTIFALIAALFGSLRELQIKRFVKQAPEVISLATRFFGSLVLLLLCFHNELRISNWQLFATVTAITVVLTAIASIIRLKLVQVADISFTTPWMGLIPLFMVFWSGVILREFPGFWAFAGIVLVCSGSIIISYHAGSFRLNKVSGLMLLVTGILGLTTTLDKLAIGSASAFTYILIWTLVSTLLMVGVVRERKQQIRIFDRHLMIQALLWVVEFFAQMLAVQYAMAIPSGTTYVKTLTMLNIVITTIIGAVWFKEAEKGRRFLAALLIFSGAVCLVVFK